nr:hypothetical protein [Tanacetum cinerariifolium]
MLFAEYTGIKFKEFRETLLLHMGNVKKYVDERTRHKRQYDRRMDERQIQSRDNIRSVNDQEPSAEVHLTTQHNVLANEQQHTDQSKPSYDTYLLEKVDSNTIPDSTNKCHRGGEIDQDAEQDQVKSSLLKAEWKPTGKIFKTVGLRWIPTGKMFIDCTTKVDSESLNGSDDDITNPYECDQTLNVSAGTLNLSLDTVFCPLFDEYFNPPPRAVSPVLVAIAASRAIDPAVSPLSTTIDQDVS